MNRICHTLLEATIALYPVDANDQPITAFPIWTGVEADNLSISERWINVKTQPTGSPFPRNHPLQPQYEIAIGRIWALPLADLNGFIPENGRYVLDIVWKDEDGGQWHRETYYGVTISERSRPSREADREFIDGQVFEAEYFLPANGTGSVVAISSALPYLLKYVTATGSRFIYRYDPATHAFAEFATNISASTAVVGYIAGTSALLYRSATHYRTAAPYRSNTQAFRVRFNGASDDAMRLRSDGVVEVASIYAGAPLRDQVPRVDFCYGNKRLASITRSRRLFAWSFDEATPVEISPGYEFFNGSTLLATLTREALVAADFQVQ